jgi:hypothetical protein
MDQLGDPLTTHPIQTHWEFTMELYPIGQFGFNDDLDRQFGNGSVWTQNETWSDGPELLLRLFIISDKDSKSNIYERVCLPINCNRWEVEYRTGLEKGINCASHWVIYYSIYEAPVKSVTHLSFWYSIYITTFQIECQGRVMWRRQASTG